jgi:hypothetical protein
MKMNEEVCVKTLSEYMREFESQNATIRIPSGFYFKGIGIFQNDSQHVFNIKENIFYFSETLINISDSYKKVIESGKVTMVAGDRLEEWHFDILEVEKCSLFDDAAGFGRGLSLSLKLRQSVKKTKWWEFWK